jgi:hypothetical protein
VRLNPAGGSWWSSRTFIELNTSSDREGFVLPSRDELLAKVADLAEPPLAFEAQWDGDSGGWGIVLAAVLRAGPGFRSHNLAFLRGGGDFRLFNGQVPPWPEARLAAEVGAELAERFGVPFYFPSPDHPEDDCPDWVDRERGSPCRRCGILLLQHDPCPWKGVCYHCHLAEEKEKKEATWTSEERAGPRCYICGNPAKATRRGSWMCPSCLERYEDYQCSRCGGWVCIAKTEPHTDVCSGCDLRMRLDAVPVVQREAIRAAIVEVGEFAALRVARQRLWWGLKDTMAAIRELSK